MPGDQGIYFLEAEPHIFSGTIEDWPDASFYLEPTLSLESPLPVSLQAYHWPVDSSSSVGVKNRLSFLMDQSSGQALESSGARNCQGEPGQRHASGYRVKPATGCVPCALFTAPTARGMTCENQAPTKHDQNSGKPSRRLSFLCPSWRGTTAIVFLL